MLRKLRCSEWFVILGIVAILSYLAWNQYVKWRERRWYEDRIDAFDRESVPPLVLPAERIVAHGTLSGRWVTAGHRYGSTLIFKRVEEASDSHYRVEFATHTCITGHIAQRTAEYRDGRVTLDRPVAEALGAVYQQLRCVRVGTKRVLVSEARSEDMARLLAAIDNAEAHNQWDDLKALAYVHEDQ